MHDPAPVPEPTEPHTDAPSMAEEPLEIDESFTASPTTPEVPPVVLETPSDSTPGPNQELFAGMANDPEIETDPGLCPADVSDRPCPQTQLVPMPSQRSSPQTYMLTLTPCYLKHQREANNLFLYPAEGPDRASSQNDIPRSADYKCYQLPRHRLDHLYGCSRTSA